MNKTSLTLTPGKLAGMKAVSTESGIIAAAAMDQRGSLKKALGQLSGGEVSDVMMEDFKGAVTEVLTPHASAILLDPQWGIDHPKSVAPTPDSCWRTRRAATTTCVPDGCRTCFRTGQSDALRRLEPIA